MDQKLQEKAIEMDVKEALNIIAKTSISTKTVSKYGNLISDMSVNICNHILPFSKTVNKL